MKHFTSLFFLLLIIDFSCEGSTTAQIATFESQADGLIRNETALCFIDTASYVNGGTTFTYPAGLFSSTPTIRVSLEENGTTYSTSQVFVAEITASSSISATIRVNLVTTSVITEASNDAVLVHFYAIALY